MLTETLSVRGEQRLDVELDGVNGMRDPPASQELKWGASASGGGDVMVLRCGCHHPRLLRTEKGDGLPLWTQRETPDLSRGM